MGMLYTGMKVFHFKDKLDSLPRERAEILPPIHIRLKPTNVCNHRCRYCAYRAPDLQLGRDMSTRDQIPQERMQELVRDLGDMGVKAVTFSGGGEPFCYPHLLETAQGLAERGIALACLTNGSRLTGEVASFFAHQATWLRISLDGWDEQSYASYRGVEPGSFGRLLANMEQFAAQGGGCLLGVSLIVDADNAAHVYETARRVREAGAHSIKISPCIISNSGAENNAYHLPVYDLVKEQTARAQAELQGEGFEVYDAYHLLEERFDKPYHWCPYLQVLPVIGADLRVYSCQDKAYNLDSGCLGSIQEQGFAQFWSQGKEKFFAIDPSRDCGHHCVANAKNKMVLEYLGADQDHLGFV